jgi:hypothetical protein
MNVENVRNIEKYVSNKSTEGIQFLDHGGSRYIVCEFCLTNKGEMKSCLDEYDLLLNMKEQCGTGKYNIEQNTEPKKHIKEIGKRQSTLHRYMKRPKLSDYVDPHRAAIPINYVCVQFNLFLAID